MEPVTGEKVASLDEIAIFPNTHYATSDEKLHDAVRRIESELQDQLAKFDKEGKLLEAQRLRMRTEYDLEMLQEMGFCNGIENYSAHLDGRSPGEPPNTLLNFFPSDYLTIIDESHVTIPQLHGQ
jgi:excinuclease ABC subunit B